MKVLQLAAALLFIVVSLVKSFADTATDQAIEKAAALSYNLGTVLEKQVFVHAVNGVATLTGKVLDQEQSTLAEHTVRELPGVVEVQNQLQLVAPGRERSDGWIALKIRSVLLLRANVSAKETDVSVRDGNVILTGTAESVAQKELTENYARNVEGVKSVTNEIAVRAPIGVAQFADTDRSGR